MSISILYLIVGYLALVVLLGYLVMQTRNSKPVNVASRDTHQGGSCSKQSCGAMDPVSDPAYNMENVVKQSILLEEHLAEENKYCKDCVAKHFLHIIGLLEEAKMLAGGDANKYPKLDESYKFYVPKFSVWKVHRDDRKVHLQIVSDLRSWRKDLMKLYVLV